MDNKSFLKTTVNLWFVGALLLLSYIYWAESVKKQMYRFQ